MSAKWQQLSHRCPRANQRQHACEPDRLARWWRKCRPTRLGRHLLSQRDVRRGPDGCAPQGGQLAAHLAKPRALELLRHPPARLPSCCLAHVCLSATVAPPVDGRQDRWASWDREFTAVLSCCNGLLCIIARHLRLASQLGAVSAPNPWKGSPQQRAAPPKTHHRVERARPAFTLNRSGSIAVSEEGGGAPSCPICNSAAVTVT